MQTIIIIDEKTGTEVIITGVDNIEAYELARKYIKNPVAEVKIPEYFKLKEQECVV